MLIISKQLKTLFKDSGDLKTSKYYKVSISEIFDQNMILSVLCMAKRKLTTKEQHKKYRGAAVSVFP